jgi:hypothetical protein
VKQTPKYVTGLIGVVAVWNAIGIISRVEYIARKLVWIWKATARRPLNRILFRHVRRSRLQRCRRRLVGDSPRNERRH